MLDIYFNPLPRKRENLCRFAVLRSDRYFNPLPRKRENDAPVWTDEHLEISIHSLVRGRTLSEQKQNPALTDFNPLPRKRENHITAKSVMPLFSISIHSLVRGRTRTAHHYQGYAADFNPLPRKRENHRRNSAEP